MDDLGLPSLWKPAYGCLESEGAKRLIEMEGDGGYAYSQMYTFTDKYTHIFVYIYIYIFIFKYLAQKDKLQN